jgi:hypothetical protein
MSNVVNRILLLSTVLLCVNSHSVNSQSVQQSGTTTPGHSACWATTGVIYDCGLPAGSSILGAYTANDFLAANSSGSIIDSGLSATGANAWTGAQAFNGGATAPTRTIGDSTQNLATTAFVQAALAGGIVATQYYFLIGNASGIAVATALSGDCTYGASGIICTKTNGAAFVASATTDTTNAANISSGTLPAGRMPALTGDVTTSAGAVATTIAANAVTNAKAAQAPTVTFKCNPTNSTANVQDCLGGELSQIACPPNVTVETSGTAQTYTIPTCNSVLPLYLELDIVGGGASAPGSGSTPGGGANGNLSSVTFNSITYTANGGTAGVAGNNQLGGAGGTVSGCDDNIPGGQGSPSQAISGASQGSNGGGTTLASGGAGGTDATAGQAGGTNTGAGGGSGGVSASVATAPGGGGGATCRKLVTVGALTSATYTVGGTATGGTGGTSGAAGGVGAAGHIKITARWQ